MRPACSWLACKIRRCRFLLLVVFGAALASAQSTTASLPLLTHADQVRHLSADEAALGYPVRIRGVITDDVPSPDFFVQDSTAGIYVEGSTSPNSDIIGGIWSNWKG